MAFFVVPAVLPMAMPELAENQQYAVTNDFVTTTVTRSAAPTDVAQRRAAITLWEQKVAKWREDDQTRTQEAAIEEFGPCPEPRELGETVQTVYKSGGKSIYWTDGIEPIDEAEFREVSRQTEGEQGNIEVVRQQYDCPVRGKGRFRVDFLLYDLLGMDLTKMSNAALETLRLPTRVILPFVVVILLSLVTPRIDKQQLDRFYVKMKTPVDPNPQADEREMEISYEDPARFNNKRLLPLSGLEIHRPKLSDIAAFIICFIICFALIWVTVWLAKLGG